MDSSQSHDEFLTDHQSHQLEATTWEPLVEGRFLEANNWDQLAESH